MESVCTGWLRAALLFVALLFAVPIARADSADEADGRVGRIRAALVYYLVKFVEFPSASALSPIKVCAFGSDAMNDFLGPTLVGKSAHGRSFEVRLQNFRGEDAEIQGCSVVIYSQELWAKSAGQRSHAQSQNILTVCATQTVMWNGCMIEIFEEENKTRLAVDLDVVGRSALRVSSELVDIAIAKRGGIRVN